MFGLIIVNVDLNDFFTQLRTDLPDEVEVYLTNAQGDYLIHPDSKKTFGFDRGRRLRIQDDFAATADVLMGRSNNIVLETESRVAAFASVPVGPMAPERSVLLGLAMPTYLATQGITSFSERLALLVTGFSLLAVFASFILSRLLVHPLNQVVGGLNRFSKRLPIEALPTARNDEIGLLSRSFVAMANQIDGQIESLKLNEQNLHRILETATSGMVITSRGDRRILFMNTSARDRFALRGEHRTLHPLEDGLGSEETEKLYHELEQSGKLEYAEHRFHVSDREEFWALLSMLEIDYQGEAAVLASIVDISQRKAAEIELERYRNELEVLVGQRTEALVEAQRETLRNERLAAIGQLTGTVSHELRNPLGTIVSSFMLLRRLIHSDDPRVTTAMGRIDRNIARCNRIVQELLDYARIGELKLESTDLDRWLEDLLDEQELPGSIRMEQSLESAARISMDRHRLAQALINVVQNACQAMEDTYSGWPGDSSRENAYD